MSEKSIYVSVSGNESNCRLFSKWFEKYGMKSFDRFCHDFEKKNSKFKYIRCSDNSEVKID